MNKKDYSKQKKCIDCNKLITNKSIRCKSCSQKGELHSNYIDGRTFRKIPCKDCGKILSLSKYIYCKKCSEKLYSGRNHYQFGKQSKHGQTINYKGIYMRSSWEGIFANFLDNNNIKWLYESKTFDLGDCTYTPDFYLPETEEYIEIKGWWRDDAKYKFELFKIFYPNEKIQVLMQKDFRELKLLKKGLKYV